MMLYNFRARWTTALFSDQTRSLLSCADGPTHIYRFLVERDA